MSKLSFRARALDASKPMPIYLAEELPDLPDYSAINRAVPQMPSGMEKEEESEHHLQKAISGTGLIIPTPEVCQVSDLEFYDRCYPSDYKMPKQHIHMQPLWEEQEAPEYDIDTEDERWLKQQRHPELTELKFEQMMDKLEKCSGQTVVTLNEAKLLLERSDDLVIAVYDYWLNKRLSTQHPLILSVKTEHRPGQSSNNPYLAFRRRTEKMQTRKNRKNDETSYEKMLKLRRDLARALTLLELVARRESAKKELLKLTALIAERRYHAGDFANHLPDPPIRPTYTPVTITSSTFRREAFSTPYYPPRPPPTPVDQPRQREKRPYKRRKLRPAAGSGQGPRDSGVYTTSEEETVSRADTASPPDEGPFAFRRKAGCYYEMPTSTLCGDPVDPDSPSKEGLHEHEVDERHRYTLTSLREPGPRCVGFGRRRLCRGGRVAIDRVATPYDDLWRRLPFTFTNSSEYRADRDEQIDMETKAHKKQKTMTRDYHATSKYPWRRAFHRHFTRKPELWLETPQPDSDLPEIKIDPMDFKCDDFTIKSEQDIKVDVDSMSMDSDSDKSEVVNVRNLVPFGQQHPLQVRKLPEEVVRDGLVTEIRKRTWSGCSDSSYDSDRSLQPVEKEFEQLISEVNKKWLHFRPKTPSPTPPEEEDQLTDQFSLGLDTPFTVEMSAPETALPRPSDSLGTFITSEFSLRQLIPEMADGDRSGHSLDVSDDLLPNNFTGLTEAQVESILSETDLKALADDDKKMSTDLLDELVNADGKDSFLLQGRSSDGRADSGPTRRKADALGSSLVSVLVADKSPVYATPEPERAVPAPSLPAPPMPALSLPVAPLPVPPSPAPPKATPLAAVEQTPVPTANIIVDDLDDLPEIHFDKKHKLRQEDTIEEVQLPHGVQLKTVQTKNSPLKKHIISTVTHRRASDVATVSSVSLEATPPPTPTPPQIVTVAVSESLKVRLQNHLLAGHQQGVLVQNGPFPPVVAVPMQQANAAGVSSPSSVCGPGTRRVSAPLVQLAGGMHPKHLTLHPAHAHAHTPAHPHGHPLPHSAAHTPLLVAPTHTIHHVAPNKLKLIHAHPITQTQRTQLLAQNRTIAGLPAVVSLATIGEAKTPNTALLKAAPGVTQLFEIKGGQLGKAPQLVNVVRQPQPGKTTVTRIDMNDKKRHVVATIDATIKGNIGNATRPHTVNLSLDGRQLIRTTIPAVRAPQLRQQIQLMNRIQVTAPQLVRSSTDPSTSITITTPQKTTTMPSVMANLLHKNVQLPKGGPKIAISGTGGALANMQTFAITTAAQLKARQARLIAQPRPTPMPEIVDTSNVGTVGASTSSTMPQDSTMEAGAEGEDVATNGGVRRRAADSVPMEVT